ncbi:ATP-binding cassette domain-containing protein [Henriciella sp.]|uniref:ATP-binding cassette domain-containing protein n=1 Tax=Henriciella sp. TaxID=1968823 RepID=UPI00261F7D8C|nr:ATP-binding cassette domain-containing protein [Henriciella sp.]
MVKVDVRDATFSYPIYTSKSRSFKNTLLSGQVGGMGGKGKRSTQVVHALHDVNLSLRPGDRLGLIGHNGAGKTTLLRLLAGISHPTSGSVDLEGRVIPLISRGLGINPELTGRENIELPLRLFGATGEEVRWAHETVPDFTELGDFLDLPVRTYSDGMRARLSFAICTALTGDILVLDEWLGAGDAGFVQKASRKVKQMVQESGIVVLASHTPSILQQNCNKLAWMRRGEIVAMGDPKEVSEAYASEMRRRGRSGIGYEDGKGADDAAAQLAEREKAIQAQTELMDTAWTSHKYVEARHHAEHLYATENSSKAAYRLGTIHFYGRGADKSAAHALPYFRHPSLSDDPWSIYHQGLIMCDPTYPQHDQQIARNLLEVAFARGIRDAGPKLAALEADAADLKTG